MFGLIAGIVAGGAFVGFNIWEKMKFTKMNNLLKEQYKFVQMIDSSKNAVLFNALMAGIAVALGVINVDDLTNIGISIALISAFFGNILAAKTHRQVLFFEKGFSLDGVYTRFKSIQSITPIKKGKQYKVLLLNQNSVVLDKAAVAVLEELRKKKG
ncbi:MAG: hypothetical protein KGZ84_07220 [Erysipelotrichia bacterium]|jgi:hypothetical protein|nr:hypothetical protein [Erysipelotrichia bacterium]